MEGAAPVKKECSSSADFAALAGRHDLGLSAWGPYSKKYIGVSHVPDPATGWRMDFSLMPGFYRRETPVPNVRWESGYHPWLAAPDLSFYRHRHELLWKDRLYCDIDFCRLDEGAVLAACTFVNATAEPQNAALNQFAWLNHPPAASYADEPMRPARVNLPAGAVWVGAETYTAFTAGGEFPRRTLLYDGLLPSDFRGDSFTGGFGLGGEMVRAGSSFDYQVRLPRAQPSAVLLLRGSLPAGMSARVRIDGLTPKPRTARLTGNGEIFVQRIALGALPRGAQKFQVTILDGDGLALDGFAVADASVVGDVCWCTEPLVFAPERLAGPRPETMLLRFPSIAPVYGLAWDGAWDTQVREFRCGDLDCTLRLRMHDHGNTVLTGPGEGHFTNVFQRPVFLKPRSSQTVYALFCQGTEKEVRQRLAGFDPHAATTRRQHAAAVARAVSMKGSAAGEKFRFSQERMAATTLSNVVYPLRTRGEWIRHTTAGRWWNCLYTWDAGFIALGLAELDVQRAVECLNAYVTEPGDPTAAFIHHGTPVPVQIHVFHELWNRLPSRALAAYFFPRLRQYHRFLAGRGGSSTTRVLKSNLLKTWDYFYNSGGWDDYPPQVHVHARKLTAGVTPVANTVHAIRTAKILKAMADVLGEDGAEFDADIAMFSAALQRWSWDAQAGYFSYVTHNDCGEPTGILRHAGGQNFNMGLDGVSPLIAGVCTPEQERRLLAHLVSPRRLWSRCGISTVDQSAAYYRSDGYWNGAVWMPHQWFIWKALLDLGATDAAWKIAATALTVWQKEVERSYHCFEHFIVATGRGAGWHAFTSLSAPVLAWYGAYFRPGRLTTGFDVTVRQLAFGRQNTGLTAALSLQGQARHTPAVVAALNPGRRYTARWNGTIIPGHLRHPGVLEIRLPVGEGHGTLEIS
jgi:hypothetical protein